MFVAALCGLLFLHGTATPLLRAGLTSNSSQTQHIYIIRHGDKYSSYPPCGTHNVGEVCFDEALMGDNPPLTQCGMTQASIAAGHLMHKGINYIVSSPFSRTLMTSLQIARTLGLPLEVEYLLSEARQNQGPFRTFNGLEDSTIRKDLEEIKSLWDLDYGSPPITTPEMNYSYVTRIREAVKKIQKRFPARKGNIVIVTHATPAFSIAYGLCHPNGKDNDLEEFVNKQDAIGPAGVIDVVPGSDHCVHKTDNRAYEKFTCGRTTPYKCDFEQFPDWYWEHSGGHGPGNCS